MRILKSRNYEFWDGTQSFERRLLPEREGLNTGLKSEVYYTLQFVVQIEHSDAHMSNVVTTHTFTMLRSWRTVQGHDSLITVSVNDITLAIVVELQLGTVAEPLDHALCLERALGLLHTTVAQQETLAQLDSCFQCHCNSIEWAEPGLSWPDRVCHVYKDLHYATPLWNIPFLAPTKGGDLRFLGFS